MIDAAFLATSFVTLFVVVDPIGLVPMFIALTYGKTVQRQREIAVRAVLVAGGLMTLFGLAGEALLTFIGISMSAFRVSWGILLLLSSQQAHTILASYFVQPCINPTLKKVCLLAMVKLYNMTSTLNGVLI